MTSLHILEQKIAQLNSNMQRLYLTKDQISTLIAAKLGTVTELREEVKYIRTQYNVALGDDVKFLTEAEYVSLMSLKNELTAKINKHQNVVNNIITQDNNIKIRIEQFEGTYGEQISDMNDRLKTIEKQMTEIKNQLASLNARVTIGGL
jgi:chromosome segregation ATPase